ncbi:hypothetical protein P7K49_021306, partial [Saguinus oedipus]
MPGVPALRWAEWAPRSKRAERRLVARTRPWPASPSRDARVRVGAANPAQRVRPAPRCPGRPRRRLPALAAAQVRGPPALVAAARTHRALGRQVADVLDGADVDDVDAAVLGRERRVLLVDPHRGRLCAGTAGRRALPIHGPGGLCGRRRQRSRRARRGPGLPAPRPAGDVAASRSARRPRPPARPARSVRGAPEPPGSIAPPPGCGSRAWSGTWTPAGRPLPSRYKRSPPAYGRGGGRA